MLRRKSWRVAALAAWCAVAQAQTEPVRIAARALVDLSLEELTSIVVSSVSRRDEPLASAPSSIYIIGADDIRRSGATSIAEALRLAPNLQVARTGAEGYAITARGFNNPLANKLLVLIDGRTVYTPLFSGVFWEVQDTMIEDIERIEVISGPGGTLWGANAVNGVVNVITKSAARTQGSVGAAGAGSDESLLALRHGGEFDGGHYRMHLRRSQRPPRAAGEGLHPHRPGRRHRDRAGAGRCRGPVHAAERAGAYAGRPPAAGRGNRRAARPEENEKTHNEIRIAEGQDALEDNVMSFGELSPFTCPECNGVLTMIREGSLMRFRCHTGHALSSGTLLASIAGDAEERDKARRCAKRRRNRGQSPNSQSGSDPDWRAAVQ